LEQKASFDENIESYWDWEEKIQLTAKFPVAYSGEALVEYREHGGGFSRGDPEKHFRAFVKVYEKNLPLLARRSRKEATQVKCNIESIIALRQLHFPLSERISYYSARNVCNRNRRLLDRLPRRVCVGLGKELASLFAQLTYQVVKEELSVGNRRLALRYWMECLRYDSRKFNVRLLSQILVPASVRSNITKLLDYVREEVRN
jgi:hypothetical protein